MVNSFFSQQQLEQSVVSVFPSLVQPASRRLLANASSYFTVTGIAFQNGHLVIKLSYSANINNKNLTFQLDLAQLSAFLPIFQLLSNISVSVMLSQTNPNSLLGVYHSSTEVLLGQLTSYICLFLSIGGILLFLLGIFARELAGIEFVLVCQYGYISLIWFKGFISLPEFCFQSLKLSTGYYSSS